METGGYSAAPAYLRISEEIASKIRSGELGPGESIPSARQISSDWGVAAATAARVQAHLRNQGLTESIPGIGSVVAERASTARDYIVGAVNGRIYGGAKVAHILRSELIGATKLVAAELGIAVGSPVIERERVTSPLEGPPESVSVSWLPGDQVGDAPLLLTCERIPEGSFAYLASRVGLEVGHGREQVSVGEADDLAASHLDIPPKSAVLVSRDWFSATDGTVLQYSESTRKPGVWLSYEFNL
jgi:DNA-binding GntR family transcriptional regulator